MKLGRAQLEHRVALAPLTRFRAPNHTVGDLQATYYGQRASKGGLLITEATFIAAEAGGYPTAPGVYAPEHVEGWRKVTEAVHAKGGLIYMQLWAIGRANPGNADVQKIVSASDLSYEGGEKPTPMTKEDIQRYVGHYKQAALDAIEAGFDGVEIHSANGYLLQQFIEESSNNRTDEYGGSLENRTRFVKEVIEAVASAIGADRTGIRLSPWTTFQGMGKNPDPYTTYLHILNYIKDTHPTFSYVHIVEDIEAWIGKSAANPRSNDPFRSVFRAPVQGKTDARLGEAYEDPSDETSPTVFVAASDFKADNAISQSELKGDVIAIGRPFIANPDLPDRIRNGQPFTPYNRDTFYTPGPVGYIDYAVYGERGHGEEAAEKKKEKEAAASKAKLA